MNRNLWASLEDSAAEEIAPIVSNAFDPETNNAADAAADLVGKTDDTYKTLESIAASLESYRETGLNPQAAQFLNISLQQQCDRVGIDASLALPALEAFAGHRGRMATTLSVESIGQTMEDVKEMLLKVIRDAVKAIMRFLSSLLQYREPVRALEGNVQKLLPKLEDKGPEAMEFRVEGSTVEIPANVAAKLHLGGKLENVMANVRKAIDFCQRMAEEGVAHEEAFDRFGNDVLSLFNATDEADFDQKFAKLVDSLPVPEAKNLPHVSRESGYETLRSNQMTGAVTFSLNREQLTPNDDELTILRKKVSVTRLSRTNAAHEQIENRLPYFTRNDANVLIGCARDVLKMQARIEALGKKIDSDEHAMAKTLEHMTKDLSPAHSRKLFAATREYSKGTLNLMLREGMLVRYATEMLLACERWAQRSAA